MDKVLELTELDEIVTREKLIDAAACGKTLFYKDLSFEHDSVYMSHLKKVIKRISLFEREHDRPILCAIVVSDNKSAEPGSGFSEFCIENEIKPDDFKYHQDECFKRWGDKDFRNANKEL